MGAAGVAGIHNVEGLSKCPYVGIDHSWSDHSPELVKCDLCENVKECTVTCESPKGGKIHRECEYCKERKNYCCYPDCDNFGVITHVSNNGQVRKYCIFHYQQN